MVSEPFHDSLGHLLSGLRYRVTKFSNGIRDGFHVFSHVIRHKRLILMYTHEMEVKHMVEKCAQLREINLSGCEKLHANVADSIVFQAINEKDY
ncbi:hypothetical protein MTR_4g008410 [Medicago truncatula]|uniref:Uncharacterized protein n=1 Tax=Medicago truncatula TaxID=3880 RepID=A0A072URY2_MEDTR|nr:hypothetical protein MTR_4g008410 [Medicago truncatula]